MWRSRLWLLYWVRTTILRTSPFVRFERAKSIRRYVPPKGTAGLARSAVSGCSRVPWPPARTMAITCSSFKACTAADPRFLPVGLEHDCGAVAEHLGHAVGPDGRRVLEHDEVRLFPGVLRQLGIERDVAAAQLLEGGP